MSRGCSPGTEATITGALLLGFGFGWALVATLTVRRTRQPQRAVVPAVTMGTTGAALVASPRLGQPDRAELAKPPLVLALAVLALISISATYRTGT